MPPLIPAPRPATLADLESVSVRIRDAQEDVNRLAEERKEIIRGLDAAGIDYKEMAAVMGVTVATVYRIVPKARRP